MSKAVPVSFQVGHYKARTANGHPIWVVFVDVPEKYDVSHVVLSRYGSLLSSSSITCTSPTFVKGSGGPLMARYKYYGIKYKKNTEEETSVVVKITDSYGRFNNILHHVVELTGGYRNRTKFRSVLMKPSLIGWNQRLSVPDLSSKHTFGVELELSDGRGSSIHSVARDIWKTANVPVHVVDEYRHAHKPIPHWKMVTDSSLSCSLRTPNCSVFELVSPILRGEDGLLEVHQIVTSVKNSHKTKIDVNASMGFHVHVSVEGMGLNKLKRICQNFVKYEDAIDLFMPRSRRTGSSNQYCKSCKEDMKNPSGSIAKRNGDRHRAIEACKTVKELVALMNPNGRYHKLNLTNLVTRRQPTIEFRQHSGTASEKKILAWVRFCVTFVHNSVKHSTTKPIEYLKNTLDAEEEFDLLFSDLIQCSILEDFYSNRVLTLSTSRGASGTAGGGHSGRPCCSNCAHGRTCESAVIRGR